MKQNLDVNAKRLLYFFAGATLLWLLLYYNTLYSMVHIWWRSETFAHGFLIFPISAYLVWEKRQRFYTTEKKPDVIFSLVLLGLVLLWGLAKSVDVLVIQQLMVVLMLPALVGAVFGYKLFKQYLFPLFYLVFAVPFGEFLIPRLQDITAIMTVWGLQVTGIPVYTEGMFISIPSGDFEVAVACSGIRYLIASLALGTLYAYLTYTKLYKQVLFVLASIIVPIIANGVRAYGIVMIAHLSDMKYATGVDHLVYGWLFFGVVIFILFYIGSFWQDKAPQEQAVPEQTGSQASQFHYKALVPVIILLFGPAVNMWMSYIPVNLKSSLQAPIVAAPWKNSQTEPEKWRPEFKHADREIRTQYKNTVDDKVIYFYASEYLFETQDKELVNAANQIFRTKKWVQVSRNNIKQNAEPMEELILRNNNEKLLIWYWYDVDGRPQIHPVKIKMTQALGKLSGAHRGGKFKAIAITFFDTPEQARNTLKRFLQHNSQIISAEAQVGKR